MAYSPVQASGQGYMHVTESFALWGGDDFVNVDMRWQGEQPVNAIGNVQIDFLLPRRLTDLK